MYLREKRKSNKTLQPITPDTWQKIRQRCSGEFRRRDCWRWRGVQVDKCLFRFETKH